jgi:hypothetical protein
MSPETDGDIDEPSNVRQHHPTRLLDALLSSKGELSKAMI